MVGSAEGSGPGFSIGEVSRAVGLAPQTLRLWERKGLIRPRRTGRGYRLYDEADVRRLREVRRMRKLEGLNFAAIRKQLGPPRTPAGADGSGLVGPGETLRRLRARAHKTLKEVSEATGLSISFISALERGGSGASVASLKALAGAYGVSMRELFGADLEVASLLVRAADRPVMRWENGVRFEEMASGTENVMDPSYLHVPSGAGSEGFYSHDGEEFVYVISGILHVELKEHGTYTLRPGDTLYFPSTTPHRWWAGDEPAQAVYVNTPPTF